MELRRTIENGKSKNYVVDRDIHQYWAGFDNKADMFNSSFDALICTKPEELRTTHSEMDHFIQKVHNDTSHLLLNRSSVELQSYSENFRRGGAPKIACGVLLNQLDTRFSPGALGKFKFLKKYDGHRDID